MNDGSWSGTSGGDSLTRAIADPVGLVAHDPHWSDLFASERERLTGLFPGRFVEIAHIGSTQVDGLAAKPVIDLLAGVRSMEEADALTASLCAHGYAHPIDVNRALPDRRFLMRHAEGRRTHHLHLVVHGSPAWTDRVAFARLLREDADVRDRYETLKRGLANRFSRERDAYTEGKSAFIRAALDATRRAEALSCTPPSTLPSGDGTSS